MKYTLNSSENYGMDNGIGQWEIKELMNCDMSTAKAIAKIINADETIKVMAELDYTANPNPESEMCHIEDSIYATKVANKTAEGFGTVSSNVVKSACELALIKVNTQREINSKKSDEYEAHCKMMARAMRE